MLDQKLQTFLTVAERRSYTLAAQALHITQPAVSQHIRKLEEHYGAQLIDFTGHQLSLTQAGELLDMRPFSLPTRSGCWSSSPNRRKRSA